MPHALAIAFLIQKIYSADDRKIAVGCNLPPALAFSLSQTGEFSADNRTIAVSGKEKNVWKNTWKKWLKFDNVGHVAAELCVIFKDF